MSSLPRPPTKSGIKTQSDIEHMRVAGRLGGEVLDYVTPFVKPGVTTGELDRLCHDYMVDVQGTIPAPLNYAPPGYRPFPKSVCTSVNHQVCHGIPGDRVLKNGDILNIDVTVIKDGYHGDTSRMFVVGEALDPGEAARRRDVRMHVARHPRGAAGRSPRRHRPRHPAPRRAQRLLGRPRVLRPRHRPPIPRGAAGAPLRQARARSSCSCRA